MGGRPTPSEEGAPKGADPRSPPNGGSPSVLDFGLIEGLAFACRPGCGLCCYGSPAISAAEHARLLTIAPELPTVPSGGNFRLIATRPNGGACALLRSERCSAHAVRPFPCREFPLLVHLGVRAQVSAVLSCPGIDLSTIPPEEPGPRNGTRPVGLDAEITAVREEFASRLAAVRSQRSARSMRAALRKAGVTSGDVTELQARVASRIPEILRSGESPWLLPHRNAGLETAPMTYFPEIGRVAMLSRGNRGVLLSVAETGGVRAELGEFPLDSPTRVSGEAAPLLRRYLAYAARRDGLVAGLLMESRIHGVRELESALSREIAMISATVAQRGAILRRLAGAPGDELSVGAVEDGIRATDAELVDRETVGAVL